MLSATTYRWAATAGACAVVLCGGSRQSSVLSVGAALAAWTLNPKLVGSQEPCAWKKWLDTGEEDPIDTHIPVIDPHHHMWDFSEQPRDAAHSPIPGWMAPWLLKALMKAKLTKEAPPLVRTFSRWLAYCFLGRYMGPEMHSDMRGHGVRKTVYIECGQCSHPHLPALALLGLNACSPAGWHPEGVCQDAALIPVGETALIDTCAASDPDGWPNAIVGHADLRLGAGRWVAAARSLRGRRNRG
jgi:hypothetical protein